MIIGDMVPHPTTYTNLKINWRDELQGLCDKGVKVSTVLQGFIKVSALDRVPTCTLIGGKICEIINLKYLVKECQAVMNGAKDNSNPHSLCASY